MKKLLPFFSLCLMSFGSLAQTLPDFSQISLTEKADYAQAENAVLQAADYILSTPHIESNQQRLSAMQFLLKWMEGTPDFTFEIDQTAVELTKTDPTFLGVYLASATKYCVENKAMSKDKKAVKLNTLKGIVAYSINPENQVKVKGELKKLIKASEKGELEKYVG